MGQLASLVASGAISADYIDVNMGCPIDELNRRGLGAGLMARPPRLRVWHSFAREKPVTVLGVQ